MLRLCVFASTPGPEKISFRQVRWALCRRKSWAGWERYWGGGVERAYEDQRIAVGGRGPELCDIEKMLQTTSEKRALRCVDALNEREAEHRVKLLN